jgi:hypothetical protein
VLLNVSAEDTPAKEISRGSQFRPAVCSYKTQKCSRNYPLTKAMTIRPILGQAAATTSLFDGPVTPGGWRRVSLFASSGSGSLCLVVSRASEAVIVRTVRSL